jgi:RNA polymerase sigma-70 factor (ECF subfamily)
VVAPIDEETLVERLKNGDEGAFATFYLRHARYVARVVFRLLGDDADLDDIVQETFVQAAEGIRRLEDPSMARRWLVTIAVRRVSRVLRRRRRWRWFGRLLGTTAPRVSDPRDRQPVDDLDEALGQLPPDLRIAWILTRIEDEPLTEVARHCGVSLATVKRRIATAEQRLQRRLHGSS